jgi:hypothetical protein
MESERTHVRAQASPAGVAHSPSRPVPAPPGTSLGSPSVKVAGAREPQNETDPMRRMWDLLDAANCSPEGEPHDFIAICPAHQGERRNLAVTEGVDGRVLLNCLAHGCDWRAITNALGVDGRALFRLGHKKGKQRGYHEKPAPVRSLSAGAAFIDSLTLAGYRWNAAVMLDECPFCMAEHCVLRVFDGEGSDRFVVSVDCVDGCGADEVRRAVETRAAIAEKGLTL